MRIPLVDPNDPSTDPATAELLGQMFEGWGVDYNILKGVANNPDVLQGFAAFVGGVFAGMPDDRRELAYLTTSTVNECHY